MSLVGQKAPEFALINTSREPVSLSSLRGKKVIVAFYPAAFSGICDKEMCTFQARLATLNGANATVLGISPDSPFTNSKFAELNGLEFDLLSDLHLDAAKAYGVVFENFAFIDGYTACNRAVFVIDEQGTVTWAWAGDHPGMEPDYDAVMAAV
jgi:peroxiredoxin